MKSPYILVLALSAALASAQKVRPFSLEAGLFLPNYDRLGGDAGVYGALGYTFYTKDAVSLTGQVRGGYQVVLEGGGGDGAGSIPLGDLTVVSGFVNARYQPLGSRLFGGLGLGVGRANQVDGKDRSGVLFAVEGGYDLSRAVYATARYEFAGADTLRGGYVGLGIRF